MSNDYSFNIKGKRPEELYESALEYFKDETLSNYALSKSIMRTQTKITLRALELLELKNSGSLILDAGCGPGFVSMYLDELGHKTIALDIVLSFLKFYDIKNLNPVLANMCFPPFQTNLFDAIISISALQWIYKIPYSKKMRFEVINLFDSFYSILKSKGKAVFQFYPKDKTTLEGIKEILAKNTKFNGSFVIDNPNSPKKRKIYLLLRKE